MTAFAWILVAAGACFIAINYWALVMNYRNRRRQVDRHHSFVPIIGGASGGAGLYLLGHGEIGLAMAAFDPGIWVMTLLPAALLRQRGHKAK